MVIKKERVREKTWQHAEMGAGPGWAGRVDVVFVVLQSLLLLLLLLLFFQHVLYLNYELLQTDKIISVGHLIHSPFLPCFSLSLSLWLLRSGSNSFSFVYVRVPLPGRI